MSQSIAVLPMAVFAAFVLLGEQVTAAIIPPIGLAPGLKYQLVFVTAGMHDGLSSDITVYNAFVAAQAALNPALPAATWRAVASTDSVNAIDNAPASGLPVYNTHGIEVSSPLSKFYFNVHFAAIQYDQFGATGQEIAWTGSTPEGIEYRGVGIGGLGNPTGRSVFGDSTTANFLWADGSADGLSDVDSFYALSSPITVPAPEPSSLVLAALGFACGVAWRRRKR